MTRYDFLLETYDTERLKTLSVWSQIPASAFDHRVEPRARSPHEQMVHQCVSENMWFANMLGIETQLPPLPATESANNFIRHYASASTERLAQLQSQSDRWFEETVTFFDVPRPRTWVLTRRIAHSAHHRGQITLHLRVLAQSLYSTYGPTADTGGLFQNGAKVLYRHSNLEELLESLEGPAVYPYLPGPGDAPVTERPPQTS